MTKNIGDIIKELIEEKKDREKCNEKIVAACIGTTEKRFRNILSGIIEFKASEIVDLAEYFGVSTDRILTGSEEKNRTVARELGLSDDAISYLKGIKAHEHDYQASFVDASKDYIYDTEVCKVQPDKPITEGGSTDEVLFILNWILSHKSGQNLLSLISKYCLVDGSQGWKFAGYIDSDFPFIECDEVYYKNRVGEGYTMFNPAVLRYALIPAITDQVNTMRDEILKGDVK